jgi:thiosulfate dehydrogenase
MRKFSKTSRICLTAFGLAFVAGILVTGVPYAQAGEQLTLANGAKLYDKWYKVIKAKAPETSHPAYPADKKYAGKPAANWRCKECHGWDGLGRDGAYAGGKHFSGIKGINGMIGADPAKVIAVLKDANHLYGDEMTDSDLGKVALFVSRGQIDYSRYIDSATKKVKGGNAVRGEAYFNTICSNCHGTDGNRPKDMGKTLAKQMSNPWEVMHKILNGQPGEQMPALRALDRQIVVDIMAHISTLPTN